MIKKIIIYIIRFYQTFISIFFIPRCRFTPTCSSFAIDSIKKHGVLFGSYHILCRLLRCHPFNNSNHYDPIQ